MSAPLRLTRRINSVSVLEQHQQQQRNQINSSSLTKQRNALKCLKTNTKKIHTSVRILIGALDSFDRVDRGNVDVDENQTDVHQTDSLCK